LKFRQPTTLPNCHLAGVNRKSGCGHGTLSLRKQLYRLSCGRAGEWYADIFARTLECRLVRRFARRNGGAFPKDRATTLRPLSCRGECADHHFSADAFRFVWVALKYPSVIAVMWSSGTVVTYLICLTIQARQEPALRNEPFTAGATATTAKL